MEIRSQKNIWLIVLAYLTIYIVWGSTYFFIKMAVETIPPFYVVGFRWFLGGMVILLVALLSGRFKKRPSLKELGAAAFLGILLLIGGNGLVTAAEQGVDSYLAALVLASTPMAVAFFDRLLFKKKLVVPNLIGMLAGLCGVGLLLYNGKSIFSGFTLEMFLLIGGLIFWSLATSLGHKMPVYPDSLVNSGLQMSIAGVLCLILLAIFTPDPLRIFAPVSTRSWFGLIYLTILGSVAFVAFNFLIAHEPAIRITSYAFINPAIAILLGLLIGGETPVPFLCYGFPLILIGLFFMLYAEQLWAFIRKQGKPDKIL